MNKIEEIASTHLGKAGDGSIVKPYITPEFIDRTLLVGVPRYLNREQYGINELSLPFFGFDMWNCYEVSAMTDNGYPVSGVLKIAYSAGSPNIVESKSLKLYLNSFNLVKLGKTVQDVREAIERIVTKDLTECVGIAVICRLHLADDPNIHHKPIEAKIIEQHIRVEDVVFDRFNESPDLLQVVNCEPNSEFTWTTNVLRSNCRVTNQPDWGDLIVSIHGEQTVTPESLLQYIVSMRKENHFHEEIVECITKRLIDLLPKSHIGVCAFYTRRGGIDINPVRCSSPAMYSKFADVGIVHIKHVKTDRQ